MHEIDNLFFELNVALIFIIGAIISFIIIFGFKNNKNYFTANIN